MSDDHLPASTDAAPSGSVQAAAPGPAQTHPSPSPAHVFLDQGRLSPRSRAHSAASSVDSSRASTYSHWVAESPSSNAHTRPSLDLRSATLKPAHQVDGFLVDVPVAGQWLVRWNELIDLLASSQTMETLAPHTLIAEMAHYVRNRLDQAHARNGGSHQPSRPSTAVSALGANLHDLSVAAGASTGQPAYAKPPAGPGFAPPPPPGSFYARGGPMDDEEDHRHRHPTVAPMQTVGHYFLAPINTQLPVPPPQYTTTGPTPTAASMQGRRATSMRPGSPTRSFSGRNESGASSNRLHLRQSSAPYPRPTYLHSSTYTSDYGASNGRGGSSREYGDYDDAPTPDTALPHEVTGHRANLPKGKGNKNGPLRPLNRDREVYLWNPRKGQLSRIPPGVEPEELEGYQVGGAEILVFPPGSYQKLIDDDGLEVLPCDARPRLNAWLKAQRCVEGCSFRFEGKRPSVIRAHVVHCKNRAIGMTVDPLKRLCQLQLEAHTFDTRMRADSKAADPPALRKPPRVHAPVDDYSDSRSVISFESVDSYGYSTASSQGSIYEQDGQMYDAGGQVWEPQYASTKAAEEFNESSAASVLSAGFSSSFHGHEAQTGPGQQPPQQEQWLESYGLSVPTGSQASSSAASSMRGQQAVEQRTDGSTSRPGSSAARTTSSKSSSRPSSFLEL